VFCVLFYIVVFVTERCFDLFGNWFVVRVVGQRGKEADVSSNFGETQECSYLCYSCRSHASWWALCQKTPAARSRALRGGIFFPKLVSLNIVSGVEGWWSAWSMDLWSCYLLIMSCYLNCSVCGTVMWGTEDALKFRGFKCCSVWETLTSKIVNATKRLWWFSELRGPGSHFPSSLDVFLCGISFWRLMACACRALSPTPTVLD
jgi:hypothetical protein